MFNLKFVEKTFVFVCSLQPFGSINKEHGELLRWLGDIRQRLTLAIDAPISDIQIEYKVTILSPLPSMFVFIVHREQREKNCIKARKRMSDCEKHNYTFEREREKAIVNNKQTTIISSVKKEKLLLPFALNRSTPNKRKNLVKSKSNGKLSNDVNRKIRIFLLKN